MGYVLCATDFKEAALNAIHYACGLSRQFGAELVILHSQSISNKIVRVINKTDSETVEKMNALVKKIKLYFPDVNITGEVLSGPVIESLHDYTRRNGAPYMVVVGNNYNPEHQAFMDDNLLQIFKNLKCPVVAIPKNRTFHHIKKLCFAYDNKLGGSEGALREITDFVVAHDIKLSVIIGWADAVSQDNIPEINPVAAKILSPANPAIHFIRMKHLNTEINDFAVKHHMDWLVIMPRKRNFMTGMLHKSHTQYLVNNTDFPIMALNED